MNDEAREGRVVYGPQRPPHLQFGNQGSPGWGFGGIDGAGGGGGDQDGASDAGSMMANADGDDVDVQMANSVTLDDSPPDLEPADDDPYRSAAGVGTPDAARPSSMEYQDDHTMYSGGRDDGFDDQDGTLYVENAGHMGADAESNSTHEIRSPLAGDADAEDSERLKKD